MSRNNCQPPSLALKPADPWNDHVNRANTLSDLSRFGEALLTFEIAATLRTKTRQR
jgi:hypothetical protein